MHSGREVVGAATIPPVGAWVSAFSVRSERPTASPQRPPWPGSAWADHCDHHSVVSATAATASSGGGEGSCDGCHASTNGTTSPAPHGEAGHGREVDALQLDRRVEHHRVRPGDGEPATVERAHPRDGGAVVEPQDQFELHRDGALDALDQPHEVRDPLADGHGVDDADGALVVGDLGLEHRASRVGSGAGLAGALPPERSASARARADRAARRSRRASRTGAGRASRSSHPGRRAPRSACRR